MLSDQKVSGKGFAYAFQGRCMYGVAYTTTACRTTMYIGREYLDSGRNAPPEGVRRVPDERCTYCSILYCFMFCSILYRSIPSGLSNFALSSRSSRTKRIPAETFGPRLKTYIPYPKKKRQNCTRFFCRTLFCIFAG